MRRLVLALSLSVLAAPVAEAAKGIHGRVRGGAGYVVVGTSTSGHGVTQTLGAAGKFVLRFPATGVVRALKCAAMAERVEKSFSGRHPMTPIMG